MRGSRIWTGLLVVVLATVLAGGQLALADDGPDHQAIQVPPVKMGTSGGSIDDVSRAFCCSGTLGGLVLYDDGVHILSNNHVLARSGSAVVGEETLQPGLIDTGCRSTSSNFIGDFIGDVVPLGTANVDAALSLARAGMVDETGYILDIGVPCTETQTPAIGMSVMKSGRTTGFTTGTITALDMTVTIKYQPKCGSGKGFNITAYNQVATGVMSAGGDSGSLLFSDDGTPNPVALLYAGSSVATIYNPIQDVVAAFTAGGHSFSFVGATCGATAAESSAVALDPDDVDNTRRVKAAHEKELFGHPGVIGVGVGAGEADPTAAAVVVFLHSPSGKIPQGIPFEVEGKEVRVIFTDPFVAH